MKIPEKISNLFSSLSERKRYVLLSAFLVFIFLADYLFVMRIQLDTLNTINPRLTILKQDIQDVRDNIPKISSYQIEINKLTEQFQKNGFIIPLKEEVSSILEGISRLANQNKIKIEQMMPVKGAEELLFKNNEGKYYSFSIFVEADGGYHDIGRFLNQIEKDALFKSVSAFSITDNPKDSMNHSVKMTIKAIILEKPEPQGSKG